MYAEPVGFDRVELARAVRAGWGVEVARMRYEAVGFGTHHYRVRARDGTGWFVNVDELAGKTWLGGSDAEVLRGLEKSFGTAAALRDAGLEFVHAPHPTSGGSWVVELPGGYGVSLVGLVDGTSRAHGAVPAGAERWRVLAALGRMHAATGLVPPGLPVRDSLAVPLRDEFFDGRAAWAGGPYAEPTRELVAAHADLIRDMFARFDALVPAVLSTSDSWAVTHGEPHAGNVMATGDGAIKLIDWDTVALGPPERDLWLIEPRTGADWAAYGYAASADPKALELFRLRWSLSEICGYTVMFRGPHVDDENTRVAWRGLGRYLAGARE